MVEERRRRRCLTVEKKMFDDIVEQRKEEARERLALLDVPVAEAFEGSTRIINTLEGADIITLEDLLDTRIEVLMSIPNFGEKSMAEVEARLSELGFLTRWKAQLAQMKTEARAATEQVEKSSNKRRRRRE
jgi:DNA-directed RNA polymerase alpha subunit